MTLYVEQKFKAGFVRLARRAFAATRRSWTVPSSAWRLLAGQVHELRGDQPGLAAR